MSAPTCTTASVPVLSDAVLDAILLTYAWNGDADVMRGHAAIHEEEREKLRALIATAHAAACATTEDIKHG